MSIKKIGTTPPPPPVEPPPPPPPPKVKVKVRKADRFEEPAPTPVQLDGRGPESTSQGRRTQGGTADDSIGRRGTGGTPDDSIGRNGGTPDDSIGGDGEPVRETQGERPTWLANRLPINRDGLSAAASAKIDECLSDENPTKAAAASYAFSTAAFAALAAPEREKFVDLMSKTNETGSKLLARLAEKSGDAFFETATDGTSTLDNLQRLASSPKASTFLNTALADIANPNRIMQGGAPTCTAASMQYELADERPAEYARLITGLALEGRVTMAGGGELVGTPAAALAASNIKRDQRSPTEAVFQNAVMEFANGADTYNQLAQQSTGTKDGQAVTYKGLYPEQIRSMVGQLFGTPYDTREIQTNDQARTELQSLDAKRQANRPVFFDIDFGDFNHNVAFEGIRDGKVLYHDPYTGKHEAMPTDEFIRRATAIHVAQPGEVYEPRFLDVQSFMRNYGQQDFNID